MKTSRNYLQTGLCGLTMLAVAGCGSLRGHFKTQTDPSYNSELGRVVLAYYMQDKETSAIAGARFSGRLLEHLQELLAKEGISSRIVPLNRDDLDSILPLKAAVASSSPNQIIFLSISHIYWKTSVDQLAASDIPRFRSRIDIKLKLDLVDLEADRIVWRADGEFSTLPRPKDAAVQFFQELAAAGFLGTTHADSSTSEFTAARESPEFSELFLGLFRPTKPKIRKEFRYDLYEWAWR